MIFAPVCACIAWMLLPPLPTTAPTTASGTDIVICPLGAYPPPPICACACAAWGGILGCWYPKKHKHRWAVVDTHQVGK